MARERTTALRRTIGERLMERGGQAIGLGLVLFVGGYLLDKMGI